jgi:hypothetical protein
MIVETTLDALVSCDFSRNIRIGVLGRADMDRSLVVARLARLLALPSKLGGLSSKSSGKKAFGALWKSTKVPGVKQGLLTKVRFGLVDGRGGIGFGGIIRVSSRRWWLKLAKLVDRLEKLLAMLAMLSLRMTELAEARIGLSGLLDTIPGKANTSRDQTSVSAISSRMRSARRGARVGTWLEDMCD